MLASGFKCNSCYLVLTPKACKFSEMQLSPHQISEVSDQPPSSALGSTHMQARSSYRPPNSHFLFSLSSSPLSFSSPSLPFPLYPSLPSLSVPPVSMCCGLDTMFFLHCYCTFSSVQFSRSVVSDSLRPHESQHARPPCPSPTPGVHSDSRPSSQWCHPAISSSVVPFFSCPQSLPASESSPMSRLFA